MANYEPAYRAVMSAEGGYSNRAVDRGGETYCGISRKYYPHWVGWGIVDQYPLPNKHGIDKDPKLPALVQSFYKSEYWDKFQGDKIRSQTIAEELFDTGVNMGLGAAVKFLQRALNVLNRRGKLYPDLEIDGGMGPTTLSSLNTMQEERLLFKIMNILQGSHYVDIMLDDETQEDNARGWFNRVSIEKIA